MLISEGNGASMARFAIRRDSQFSQVFDIFRGNVLAGCQTAQGVTLPVWELTRPYDEVFVETHQLSFPCDVRRSSNAGVLRCAAARSPITIGRPAHCP
jgi:hypothetical protein